MSHFKTQCNECDKTIAQCRCISHDHGVMVNYKTCDECKARKASEFSSSNAKLHVCWQNPHTGEPWATVEEVIQAAIDRLELHNAGPLRCRENSIAITDLQSAQNWLQRRTANQQARGVDGTQDP